MENDLDRPTKNRLLGCISVFQQWLMQKKELVGLRVEIQQDMKKGFFFLT